MWGIELADPRDGRAAGDLAREVQAHALRRGLILELGGRDDCVVRMLPPLNVTADIVDTACSILIEVITRCCPEDPAPGGSPAARTSVL
jgi:diaminobutyrate-2-oxoglutarate transaminase